MRNKRGIFYFIAFIMWADALLMGFSGMLKPEHGRWWQGLLIFAVVITIGTLCFFHGRRESVLALRREKGLCLKCGYDLRSTPERCPECGTIRTRD
jgi:drug/metabolite transporter (DMT)-like permease